MRIVSCIAWGVLAFGSLGCETKVASKPATGGAKRHRLIWCRASQQMRSPWEKLGRKQKDGQEVTLVGLIGGSSKPFIEGWQHSPSLIPKFPIVRRTRLPTPWDYCCQTEAVKANIATVKIVDDAGKPVSQSARELLNVKELSTVVVKGKAKRDDQGNLTVAANQVFRPAR